MSNRDESFLTRVFDDDTAGDVELPPGLEEKLYAIPRREKRKRWYLSSALAASVVLVISVLVVGPIQNYRNALKAEHQLYLALHYLEKTNMQAEQSLHKTLNQSLKTAALNPVFYTVANLPSGEGA